MKPKEHITVRVPANTTYYIDDCPVGVQVILEKNAGIRFPSLNLTHRNLSDKPSLYEVIDGDMKLIGDVADHSSLDSTE